jgi:hypothetical protein
MFLIGSTDQNGGSVSVLSSNITASLIHTKVGSGSVKTKYKIWQHHSSLNYVRLDAISINFTRLLIRILH